MIHAQERDHYLSILKMEYILEFCRGTQGLG